MKNMLWNRTLAICSAIMLCAIVVQADSLQSECKQAVQNFKNADPAIQTFIDNSAGYAVFPGVGKGGFIVGGAHGQGLVFEKGKITGEAKMTQASIGAQAGGQSFAEIIFFENEGALNNFKGSNFEMGADVSAVAVSEGASKSAKYQQGVAVFTLPKKGLMVQAAVGGQKFKFQPITTTK